LESQKDILAKQLATQQNTLQRANQLAEGQAQSSGHTSRN
jgi:hypothetical protein